MIVESLEELSIVGIFDRGVANQERIVLRPNQPINMGQYGVMLGVHAKGTTSAFPIRDHLFWFGDGIIEKDSWLFIYTGPGDARKTSMPNTNEIAYVVHWGKPATVLADTDIVPIIFRVDSVAVGLPPGDVPQGLLT